MGTSAGVGTSVGVVALGCEDNGQINNTECMHTAGFVTIDCLCVYTSEMIHHHGASLSKQQTADLLLCHGTQQDLSLSTV